MNNNSANVVEDRESAECRSPFSGNFTKKSSAATPSNTADL